MGQEALGLIQQGSMSTGRHEATRFARHVPFPSPHPAFEGVAVIYSKARRRTSECENGYKRRRSRYDVLRHE